ncbi:DUF2905 domain-containing protein [Pectinatus sottacetonis]|uniref:DUF2905 domain-containing protein n=1 Tax=Pectinatus sottacetonis TaxID=1002795 RepID=UPI0018C5EE86|nr:DUF2905 domain-containing protein [Pectinatus sottacetonis]
MNDLGKIMIWAGVLLVVMGTLFYFGSKFFALGRLPGDFKWENSNFGVYFPLGSSIVISIILTILLNVFLRH